MARVPLVVVRTSVRPPTRSGVQSSGELPRSKPSMGSPPRSPGKGTGSGGRAGGRERAGDTEPVLLAGERGGYPIDGFDLGNSPLDCTCMTGRALPAAVAESADLQTERV